MTEHSLITRTVNVLDNSFKTHQLIRWIQDINGIFAALMKTAITEYYLVARAPPPSYYQDCKALRIQKDLVDIAAEKRIPILMAQWWEKNEILRSLAKDPGRPTWRLIDPQTIKDNLLGEELRRGVIWAFFEAHLGEKISDPVFIPSRWFSMTGISGFEPERLPLKSKETKSSGV